MSDGLSLTAYTAAALVTAESLRKLVVSRVLGHELGRDYVTIGLAAIGVSLAAGAPTTLRWSDSLLGVVNLASVVSCAAAMATMVCAAGFLRTAGVVCVRVRVATAVYVASVGAMGALYLTAGTHDPEFGATGYRQPASLAFSLIYLCYMAVALGMLTWGMRRIGRDLPPSVRHGLSLAAIGFAVGLLGVVWELVALFESWWRPPGRLLGTHLSFVGEAIAAVTFAAGTVFSAAAQHLDNRREAVRATAVARLWNELEPVHAENPLGSPDDDVDLHRQKVEVFDAFLTLRRYTHPELGKITEQVVNRYRLRGRRAHHVRTAATQRAALAAYQAGLDIPMTTPTVEPRPEGDLIRTDDDVELAWLANIAKAWHDPAVNEILAVAQAQVLQNVRKEPD